MKQSVGVDEMVVVSILVIIQQFPNKRDGSRP